MSRMRAAYSPSRAMARPRRPSCALLAALLLPAIAACGSHKGLVGAKDAAVSRGIGDVLISISHCRTYATAYALALGKAEPSDDKARARALTRVRTGEILFDTWTAAITEVETCIRWQD